MGNSFNWCNVTSRRTGHDVTTIKQIFTSWANFRKVRPTQDEFDLCPANFMFGQILLQPFLTSAPPLFLDFQQATKIENKFTQLQNLGNSFSWCNVTRRWTGNDVTTIKRIYASWKNFRKVGLTQE